jgi:peptide/nickel transport system permease protein
MRRFLIRRAIFTVFSIFAATVIVFVLSRATDPLAAFTMDQEGKVYSLTAEHREKIEAYLGLDKPVMVQYLLWIWNALHFDFGETLLTRSDVGDRIKSKLWPTVQLGGIGFLLGTVTGVVTGVITAIHRGGVVDYVGRFLALAGQSLPGFYVAIVAIVIFSVYLDWLPATGRGFPEDSLWEKTKHFILPTFVIGWGGFAGYLRMTRSAMLEIMDSEFIKLARAKGVSERGVIWKHAFRNAIIPPITITSLSLAGFITGAAITELIFSWPGIGRMGLEATFQNDIMMMSALVLLSSVSALFFMYLADIVYVLADPRIRYT